MLKLVFSDSRIIEDIASSESNRNNRALKYLYEKYYMMAFNIIKKNGGAENDVLDVYQESIIALYEAIKNNKYRGDSKISTWLYSTIFNQWAASTRKSSRVKSESIENQMHLHITDNDDTKDYSELLELVYKLLDLIGETCKEVLIDYYYNKYSMRDIMDKMGFKSEQVAKNKKFRCKEKLDSLIAERPGLKQHLNRLYDEG